MEKRGLIVVWFSCGAASAVAAKMTIDKYGHEYEVRVVNNPVDEEDDDNKRFLVDVSKWLGVPIVTAKNEELGHTSANQVWEDRKYMSGIKGAPCTTLLKKVARYLYESANKIDFHVLGFTSEEKHRHDRFVKGERENVLPVLIEAGITKSMCFDILIAAGIKLPHAYAMGFPNANCIGCVKATSPTYWNHVRKKKPSVFASRSFLSRMLGVRLVRYKGKRIFLDELPEDAKGRKMKSYECGIFCDTK
jgi:hypothetical protein